ncbi:MAG: CAP domain-containing protein [Dehalococcoidia bacterium]
MSRAFKPAGTVLLAAVLLVAGAAMAQHFAEPSLAAGPCVAVPSIDSEEQAFLGLINSYRAANGLGALSISATLSRSAQWKSEDMGANNYFAHDDVPSGRTWAQRIRDCGYTYSTFIGENLAAGMSSAQSAFDAWKASPGHDANMLNPNYAAIGIGRAYSPSSTYGWYWSTDFGGVEDSTNPPTPTPTATTPPLTNTPTPTPTATTPPSTNTPTPTGTPPDPSGTPSGTPTNAPSPTPTSAPASTNTPLPGGTPSPTPPPQATGGTSPSAQAGGFGSGPRRILIAGLTRH